MGKVLIAITCMTIMSTHAAKLDNLLSGRQGFPSVSGVRSNVGSTFNTRNPTFNNFNQASSGNFGAGGISSSIVGSLGNLNLGAQGSIQGYGYNAPQILQVSGLNFGSPLGVDPASQGSNFNAVNPGLTFTGFAPNFNQIPTTFFAGNSGQQGLTTSRLNNVPSFTTASGARFTSGPLVASNFGQGSTTISLSPISFGNTNSQSSTGSGFGSEIGVIPTRGSSSTSLRSGSQSGSNLRSGSQSGSNLGEISSSIVSSPVTLDSALSQPSTGSGSEFNASPATRGSFKGPGLVTGITAGNLQSTTRFSNDPITLVAGSQRPSQSSSTGSRFNAGITSGITTGSRSGFNTGSNSGFNTGSNSGFNTGSNSGFNTGSNSGFNTGSTSGFTAGSNSGFNAGSASGFTAGSNSGFNTGSTSGFTAGSNSGFNAGSNSGFNAGSSSGFNAGSNSGFTAGSNSGFNAGITSFTTGSRPGFNTGSNFGFNAGSTSGFNAGSTSVFNAGSTSVFNAGSTSGSNAGPTSGSTSFDFGQSSGITGGISTGYLPPNA